MQKVNQLIDNIYHNLNHHITYTAKIMDARQSMCLVFVAKRIYHNDMARAEKLTRQKMINNLEAILFDVLCSNVVFIIIIEINTALSIRKYQQKQ